MESNLTKQTVFILPKHAFYFRFLKADGFNVMPIYIGGTSLVLRIFREIHFRLNLPYKSIWFNKRIPLDSPYYFVYEVLTIPEFIEWLYKRSKSKKIVLSYNNPVNKYNNPTKFNDKYCIKWTGDTSDSQKYNLHLSDGGVFFKSWIVKKVDPDIDIFFVGADKGRLSQLEELEDTFRNLQLSTYFHIVAERKYKRIKNKRYKDPMPYEEVLNYLGRTKSILYLTRGSQNCVTVRVQESLVHKIKLITDSDYLCRYDFYTPNNIFILGKDDINTLPTFLNTPYLPVETVVLKNIYFGDMAEKVLNNSFPKDKKGIC